jgi:hypothetical protein
LTDETYRYELMRDFKLPSGEIMLGRIRYFSDGELEKKLKALVKSDIISQGQTNYDYRGVGDINAFCSFPKKCCKIIYFMLYT